MKNLFKLSCLSLALTSPFISAQEADAPEDPAMKISAELGILVTTGNTESSSYIGKLTVDHELTSWRNKYTLDWLQKEAQVDDGSGNKVTEETDNRLTTTAKGSYKFTDSSAAFVFGSYTSDDYGAYSTYTSLSGGYSFRALEKEGMFLDLDAGVGFVDAKTQSTGESDNSELYRGSAAFEWQINDMTKFVQNISIEHAPGLDNTRTITESGVSASFSSDMQMKFTYQTTSNSEVAEGFEKTDTATSVTIIVNF